MARFTRVLAKSRGSVSFIRGMRFRLAAGFLLSFTLLLLGLGLVVRQMLVSVVRDQSAALLEEEWAASKGYLRIENQYPVWYYDPFDPEEALIVNRITGGVYMFADAGGNVVERSSLAKSLGIDNTAGVLKRLQDTQKKPQQPEIEILKNAQGTPYMLRYGSIPDIKHRTYLLVIGRSLGDSMRTVNQFTMQYLAIMPVMILLCSALGWLVAGKALVPVTEVAQTAQKITGANLNVRIPRRGAGDELDHLIESFNRMVARLNHSFEQIRQFSTDVSHELRTPLTAIRGQLEVALFTAETPDQFRDAMVNALQDVEQLSNIVRALLLLSQAESGQLVLTMAPVNLTEVVRDIVEQFQIPAEEADIRLTSEVPGEFMIRADKTQIERLISNLLSNAIKYTRAGGAVHAGVSQSNGKTTLWIEDTGIGIPAEKLPHIFDRFYRVRSSHSNAVQGLGLGLSFVSWIVNAHGAEIAVDSEEGKGTRFTVTFPLLTSESEPLEPSQMPVPDHAKL